MTVTRLSSWMPYMLCTWISCGNMCFLYTFSLCCESTASIGLCITFTLHYIWEYRIKKGNGNKIWKQPTHWQCFPSFLITCGNMARSYNYNRLVSTSEEAKICLGLTHEKNIKKNSLTRTLILTCQIVCCLADCFVSNLQPLLLLHFVTAWT